MSINTTVENHRIRSHSIATQVGYYIYIHIIYIYIHNIYIYINKLYIYTLYHCQTSAFSFVSFIRWGSAPLESVTAVGWTPCDGRKWERRNSRSSKSMRRWMVQSLLFVKQVGRTIYQLGATNETFADDCWCKKMSPFAHRNWLAEVCAKRTNHSKECQHCNWSVLADRSAGQSEDERVDHMGTWRKMSCAEDKVGILSIIPILRGTCL